VKSDARNLFRESLDSESIFCYLLSVFCRELKKDTVGVLFFQRAGSAYFTLSGL
jgi:hypothetical protein